MNMVQEIAKLFGRVQQPKKPMPNWVKHGSGLHLQYAVMGGPASDAWQTYPWLDTSTEPRMKPWVNALTMKCRLGSDVPSVPTRQQRRAQDRAKNWAEWKIKPESKKRGRFSRAARRAAAQVKAPA